MTTAAEMQIVVELKDKASASLKNVNNSFSKTAKGVTSGVTKMAAGFGLLLGAAAIGGVLVGLKKSVSAFTDFEDSIAGVAKTTGLTGKSLEEVSVAIKKLSTTIPVAAVELADIAAIAGQLGIQGTDNILSFTKTVSEIAVAFDMTAEQAAIAMAKLGNIYDIPIEQTSNLASAINVLGNTTAAFEDQIITFMTSMGSAAEQLGFTADQSAALGATLVSLGLDAGAAGTQMNSAFTIMGQKIDKVSDFLGITETEFKKAFGKDPMALLIQIISKLGEIEDPLDKNTKATELFGAIGAKSIKTLTGGLDDLILNLENSGTGFDENTSLAAEFAAKTNTLKASMKLLGNNLTAVAITIGSKLAPYIRDVADRMSELLPFVDSVADSFSGGFGKGILASASALKDKLQPGLDSLKSSFNSIISIISSLITSFSSNKTAMTSMASIVNVIVDAFNFCAVALEYVLNIMAKYPVITAAVVVAITLLLSPIAAVVAAMGVLAVIWDTNWLGIKDTTLKVVSFIVGWLKGEFAKLEAFWSTHGATIMAIVDFMWMSIKTMIQATVGAISLIINVFLDVLSGDWSAAWDKITAYLSTAMDNQKSLSESFKTMMLAIFSSLWTALLSGIEAMKTGMIAISSSLWTALLSGIEAMKTGMIAVSASLWTALLSGIEAMKTGMIAVSASLWTALLSGIEGLKTGMLAVSVSLWTALLLGIKNWASDTISHFTKWVSDTIDSFENFKNTTISTINNWASSALSAIVSWIADTSNKISTWTSNIITSFENWKNTVISIINDWMSSTLSIITSWAADTLNKITTWISDTLNRFTQWATDTLNRISTWAADTLNKISTWASNTSSKISSWAADTLNKISSWSKDTSSRISSWASETYKKIITWTSNVISSFTKWKNSVISIIKGWYNAIKQWFNFSGIHVKWPTIPNPFKGMDWCKYIPSWVKNVLGVCGGTVPYSKYDKYSKYNKYTKHQIYDKSGVHPPNLYSKYTKAYLTGGPVLKDLNADLHKGEYVIPKAGALVKAGSSKPSHIQMTYNIDTVNGVDNIKQLLEKHDRDLYKRLVAMV